MPFQPGNQHAANARRWRNAIDKALAKRSRVTGNEALEEIAEKLLAACDLGDMSALKELGDRLDGKPAQAVTIAGDPEQPLQSNVTVEFVRAGADSGSA